MLHDPRLAAMLDEEAVPLAVDVDGTLLRTDLLHETALQFVARHPLEAPRMIGWAARGKAVLKTRLADRCDPDVATMPLRDEVVALIRTAQAAGRPVYLASASDRRLVEAIARRIGGIAGVFASDGVTNLSGRAKAKALIAAFGTHGFDYVGDATADLPVLQGARRAILVAHTGRLEARARRLLGDVEVLARPRIGIAPLLRSLRPHQWAKNLLVFMSLVASHRFTGAAIVDTVLAFLCFCAAASSAYILNDLLDLPGDREHSRKRFRPIAAGTLPIATAAVLGTVLMPAAFIAAAALAPRFVLVLAIYVVLTLAYSLSLKRRVMIDTIVLGGLYTIRVLAGAEAMGTPASEWLLMFSLFLFLALAIIKRCSELVQRSDAGVDHVTGRGYRVGDLAVLFPLAAAAATGAVFVVTLYLSSPSVAALYAHPTRMWLMCPLLLYWTGHMLILANRGELHDDPVVYALTDRQSLSVGLLAAGVIAISV